MKRVLSVLLVFSLAVLLLAACTKSNSQPNNAGASSAPTGDAGTKNLEPLSLKVMTVNFGEQPTGKLVQEAWLAEMEKLMGRKLNIDFQYVSQADYGEKLKIMLTSGELPDLITTWGIDQATIVKYGESGSFVDLTDNLDKLPNYKKYLDAAPESKTKIYSTNDKLYAFYNTYVYAGENATTNEMKYATAIRKDIFDANGIAVPKTVEDIYQAAKKLKEVYPDKYPIMQMEEWQHPIKMLLSANHIDGWYTNTAFSGAFYNGTEHVFGPIQEGYKDALIEMNKWYAEKLISPDFFTQNQADGKATIANGDGMIIPAVWDGYPAEWAVSYPEQEWLLLPGIENPKYGKPWVFAQGSSDKVSIAGAWSVVINAKSKNVDDLLTFMDYQFSDAVVELLQWGVENKTYTIKDGKKQFVDEILQDQNGAYARYGLTGGGISRSGIFPQVSSSEIWKQFERPGKIVVDGQETDLSVNDFIAGEFNVEQAVPYSKMYVEPQTAEESEQIANIMTPINTFAAEQLAAFVSGSRSFAEWDAYVKEIKGLGKLDEAFAILNSKMIGPKK
jgi:putative aldouronate transport system substrate-binding protein